MTPLGILVGLLFLMTGFAMVRTWEAQSKRERALDKMLDEHEEKISS